MQITRFSRPRRLKKKKRRVEKKRKRAQKRREEEEKKEKKEKEVRELSNALSEDKKLVLELFQEGRRKEGNG